MRRIYNKKFEDKNKLKLSLKTNKTKKKENFEVKIRSNKQMHVKMSKIFASLYSISKYF